MFCLGHGGEKLDSIGDVVQKSLFVGNGSSSHLPFRENVRRGIFSDVTRCSFHDAGNSRPRKHGYVSHTKRYGYVSHTTSHSSRCTSRSFGLRLCRRNTPHLLQRPSSTTRRIPHVLGRTKSPTKLHSSNETSRGPGRKVPRFYNAPRGCAGSRAHLVVQVHAGGLGRHAAAGP